MEANGSFQATGQGAEASGSTTGGSGGNGVDGGTGGNAGAPGVLSPSQITALGTNAKATNDTVVGGNGGVGADGGVGGDGGYVHIGSVGGANPGSFTNSTVVGGAGGDANGTGNTAGDGQPYEIINTTHLGRRRNP